MKSANLNSPCQAEDVPNGVAIHLEQHPARPGQCIRKALHFSLLGSVFLLRLIFSMFFFSLFFFIFYFFWKWLHRASEAH